MVSTANYWGAISPLTMANRPGMVFTANRAVAVSPYTVANRSDTGFNQKPYGGY
ncbi:hypothetical protein [Parapedobacter tibetensis]|uniref:hypothetical protein n=1 Tax=Parapedobacter tibetensis TaxID=2972951 RepID=UPI00214DD2AF|nr:hypothetical protein [Parapedobacter tibetensis]